MSVDKIIAEIDAEIAKLERVRALITGAGASKPKTGTRATKGRQKKRTLSAEARAKIAEAQRKRWAKQKKTAT
jgi:hypothetical protein